MTRLVASLIVRNETGRFLQPCIESLLTFCDEIVVVDDGSADGTFEWLSGPERVTVTRSREQPMFEHEGRARQALLQETLRARPTHILALDADELVTDGAAVRAACEADDGNGAFSLSIEEIWKADPQRLWARHDGAWRPHPIPICWRVPAVLDASWRIQDRQLACGREPVALRALARRATVTGSALLHLGWTNEAGRQGRFDRYTVADGGRFHASAHLRSIMLPDRRVRLRPRPWPASLETWRERILERVNAAVAA